MGQGLLDVRDAFNARKRKWDLRFMEVAQLVASWSKDESTKVGCVVVSPDRDIKVTGYNGFPRSVIDTVPERHERPYKYKWTEHAERNACYAAARLGESLLDCTLYSTLYPCADCARAVIQSGIRRIVTFEPDLDKYPQWAEDFGVAANMFVEAGVKVEYV